MVKFGKHKLKILEQIMAHCFVENRERKEEKIQACIT